MKEENAHKNHRQRLRAKVDKFGLDVFAEHEILELMLTYAIPRKDTNSIAHNLLKHFGSISAVLEAPKQELIKVEGVGPECAIFFNVLYDFVDIYKKDKVNKKSYILKNTQDCITFFREQYSIKKFECLVLAFLNASNKVIKNVEFKGRNDCNIIFDLQDIINQISDKTIHSLVLFHTHPGGSAEPSDDDLKTTQSIINACLSRGIDFQEHLIFAESEHFSFRQAGLTDKMKSQYWSAVTCDSNYINSLKEVMKEHKKTQ